MINTDKFFELAQLAEASYADFSDPGLSSKDALIDDGKGFSPTQADLFLDAWQLVSGGHQPNTDSGFSSTLFKSLDTGGGYVLAIRGTEPTTQLFKDLVEADIADIVADGIVIDQSVDLYNEWKRITSTGAYTAAKLVTLTDETAAYALAKAGQFVPGFNMAADIYLTYLRARTDIIIDEPSGRVRTLQLESSATLFSDGRQTGLGLATDIAAQGITVTGHSLGGHLADVFDRLFAGAGADAFKINGAGFATGSAAGVSDNAATNIRNLFGMLGGAASFSGSSNLNLYGDKNLEIVTMNGPGLFQQGGHEAIFIEQDSFIQDVFGHGASQISDSLAVFDLFIELDGGLQSATPQAALAKLNPLFEAASNDTAFSLESLVGALGRLFTGNGLIAQDDRESLYGLINDIKQTTLYQQSEGLLTIQPLTEFDAAIIAGKAQQSTADGLAYRYALVNLLPFAITGDAGLYASHNAAGQFDLYDPATGQGTLTAQYLKDRAKMLSWKMQYDTGAEDADDDPLGILSRADKPYAEKWDSWTIKGDWDFIDKTTGTKLVIDGVDLTTTANHQIVFGSSNADSLAGDELNDHLYGGAGDDTLTGGGGNDYLEGGAGNDTYIINPGDGHDTILDSDGQGVINLGGLLAKGGATAGLDPAKWRQSGNVWQDQQNGLTYLLVMRGDGSQTLMITGLDGSTVEVRGWSEGELGIVLGAGAQQSVVTAPASNLTIVGDLKPLDTDPGTDGIQEGYDALDNLLATGVADPGREDILYDSAGNDLLQGLGGNDTLIAWRGGDDVLEGGSGQDYLSGGAGHDTLVGGNDSDVLLGGTGNDYLFAQDQVNDLVAAILASETQPGTGARGGWLSGDDGNDILVGGAGNDVLLGGKGEDLLIGGGGNDNIYGDQHGGASIDWTLTRTIADEDSNAVYRSDITNGTRVAAAVGAADVIYGGAGDDWIEGGQGNDFIDAGADNDVVFGGEGSDVILGGSGNDVLIGNAGVNRPENDGGDFIDGGAGDDEIWGAGGNDILLGGDGDDSFYGGGKNDVLIGGSGNDTLRGEDGDDILIGGAGVDTLIGGDGNDTLIDDSATGETANLAGGTGDDLYQLGGAGDINLYDNQGYNTLALSAGDSLEGATLTQDTDLTGYCIALTNGRALNVQNGFFGTGGTVQDGSGTEVDLEGWASSVVAANLTLQLDNAGGRVFSGAGNESEWRLAA